MGGYFAHGVDLSVEPGLSDKNFGGDYKKKVSNRKKLQVKSGSIFPKTVSTGGNIRSSPHHSLF